MEDRAADRHAIAEARLRYALPLASRKGPVVNTTGYYESHCVRTPAGWRFRHKVSILDRRG